MWKSIPVRALSRLTAPALSPYTYRVAAQHTAAAAGIRFLAPPSKALVAGFETAESSTAQAVHLAHREAEGPSILIASMSPLHVVPSDEVLSALRAELLADAMGLPTSPIGDLPEAESSAVPLECGDQRRRWRQRRPHKLGRISTASSRRVQRNGRLH
eukprot:TRINITY_DN40625_c0_g1_i1.p1 TRINITY_DN40625_c0_g1~~TRINITY_DN40625_c0_g1_i1.p1  ORF type:complete len:158 (+),score=27.06 TRINITY_DN40625_c0_g1_i1:84-557(+)